MTLLLIILALAIIAASFYAGLCFSERERAHLKSQIDCLTTLSQVQKANIEMLTFKNKYK